MTTPADLPRVPRRGLHASVGVLVATAALALVAWTTHRLEEERTSAYLALADQRAQMLAFASSRVEDDLSDITDHLEFTARLVAESPDETVRRGVLTTLIRSVTAYREASLYDASCSRALAIVDPRWAADRPDGVDEALASTAREACGGGDAVRVSPVVEGASSGAYRVFARPVPGGGAVLLAVDTEPIFDRLRAITADTQAELLVLGPYGRPAPASSPVVTANVDSVAGDVAMDGVLADMRAGRRGTVALGAETAVRLGLPNADAVVVFGPITVDDGPSWSVACFVSTASLRAGQRGLLESVGVAFGAGSALLAAFGGYVVVAGRAEARYAEALRHHDRIAALKEQAERILDHAPSAMLTLDPSGRVSAANRVVRAWSPAARLRGSLADVFPEARRDHLERVQALANEALAQGAPRTLVDARLVLVGAEGRYLVHAVPMGRADRDSAVLLAIEDSTGLGRLQEQVVRMEKLATVGELAAGIAHEIGTPLGVIRGRAEYAHGKLGEDHPQADGLRVIVDEIDRISRTIRALLDFASLRAIPPGRVALRGTAERVAEILRVEAERRCARLVVEVPRDLPAVAGSADLLDQVLVNLVMNALDASPRGGDVVIDAQAGDDGIHLRVRDRGVGIAPENVQRVFDPFFTTKKRGAGTGLGLAVVNQIVRDHGGRITLESVVGSGTTFDITLPRAEAT